MSQSARGSFFESLTNILVGFSLNYLMNAFIFAALLGRPVPWRANIAYGVIMTGVSFVRSYVLRRVFNAVKAGWNRAAD
jgi:hypothetical protein